MRGEEPMREFPRVRSWHVEAGDVILIGPTPIRVERVYRHASGVMLAACLVGRFPMFPRTFTCESLARYMDTCGRELPTEIYSKTSHGLESSVDAGSTIAALKPIKKITREVAIALYPPRAS